MYSKKIIVLIAAAVIMTSTLHAGSDYKLLAEAVEFLIKQTDALEKQVEKNNKKTQEANKQFLLMKKTNDKLQAELIKKTECDCKKINKKISNVDSKIKELIKKHTEDFEKFKFEGNGVISESNSSSTGTISANAGVKRALTKINTKSNSIKDAKIQKKLRDQQERLKKYISNRRNADSNSLK